MKELASISNMTAKARTEKTRNFIHNMMQKSQETLQYWDLQISGEPQ